MEQQKTQTTRVIVDSANQAIMVDAIVYFVPLNDKVTNVYMVDNRAVALNMPFNDLVAAIG